MLQALLGNLCASLQLTVWEARHQLIAQSSGKLLARCAVVGRGGEVRVLLVGASLRLLGAEP